MPYLQHRPSRTPLRRTALAAALTLGFVFAVVPTGARETTTAKAMRDAATAFLATLDPTQKAATTFAFTSEERENWFFTPVPRKGLAYFSMTDAQRAAAVALLKTGLSAKGYEKVEHIRSLESVLWDIEGDAGKKPFVNGDGHPHRYPERYLFTIFGTPSATEPWGWRFEGHHISQNWTVVSGNAIASSPQFFGSNPAEVRTGPKTGLRVLAAEEDLARTLLQSLDETQRKAAIIDPKAPNDILTTNKHQAERLPDVGVAYKDLTKGQQQALWKLIEEYAFAQVPSLGQARIATIKKDGVDKIRFAWMGVAEKGGPHYYRVQGANFAIEYDNTQNNNNHIHAVWRDYNGDFGRDILAAHYKADRRPIPGFGDILILESEATSRYHALQLAVDRPFSHGLQFKAGYTWSTSMDDTSAFLATDGDDNTPQDSRDFAAEWGPSDFDVRHRLVASATWIVPAGPNRSAFLRDWQLSGVFTAQAGRPFTPRVSFDNSNTGNVGGGTFAYDRPNVVTGTPPPGTVTYNGESFVIAPQYTFGNAGRNSLTGPGYASLDLAVSKRIPIGGRRLLDLRAEMFNVLSRENLSLPDSFVDRPTFGQSLSALPARQVQLSARVTF